jgi:nitrogen regulatory protein PII
MMPTGMTAMFKIEVVVEASDATAIEHLFRSVGATGWTTIPGLSGVGHHGRHEGRLLFNEAGGQAMLVTVVPPERLEPLREGLGTLLEHRPGVMFVSETYVSRPGYFTATSPQ